MDGLSDEEIGGIWDRVSKYVDLGELKGTDTESIQKTLKEALEDSSIAEYQKKKLVKHGFARRAVKVTKLYENTFEPAAIKNRVEEIKEKTSKAAIKEIKTLIKKEKANELPLWEQEQLLQSALPEKVTSTPTGRLSVRTSKGTKTYSPDNIKIAYGERKQGKAYYVSYKGKRVTWGLL
jgi:hypothetical protein